MTKIEFYPASPYFLTIYHGENWVHLPWITRRDVDKLLGDGVVIGSSSVHLMNVIMSYMLHVGMSPELIKEALAGLIRDGRFEKDEE